MSETFGAAREEISLALLGSGAAAVYGLALLAATKLLGLRLARF